MNATSNSKKSIKMVIATLTTVSEVPAITPIWKVMNIMQTNDIIMACPASMFAKRRTIKANGFVNTPKKFNERHHRYRTFQPSWNFGPKYILPIMFISKQIGSKERAYRQEESYCNVSRYICSCRKMGIMPIRLLANIKKNTVRRYGEYFL